jgi:hypothetical protein
MLSRSQTYDEAQAFDLWWTRARAMNRSKGKDYYFRMYLKQKVKPPCARAAAPTKRSMAPSTLVTAYVSQEEILSRLGGRTKQRVSMTNLNEVWALVQRKGAGKERFHFSCNNHGMDPGIVRRNLQRLERLGLLKTVVRGRVWWKKNILGGMTNPASEYSLSICQHAPGSHQEAPGETVSPPWLWQVIWLLAVCLSPERLGEAQSRAVETSFEAHRANSEK